jgi:hypothetical protein
MESLIYTKTASLDLGYGRVLKMEYRADSDLTDVNVIDLIDHIEFKRDDSVDIRLKNNKCCSFKLPRPFIAMSRFNDLKEYNEFEITDSS